MRRLPIYMIGVMSYIITIIGTYLISHKGKVDEYFYGNYSFTTIIISISIFVLIKYVAQNLKYQSMNKNIKEIGKAIFGIYLIHPYVLSELGRGRWGIVISNKFINPIFAIPITAIVTFIISFLIVNIFQRIKYIKSIVP